MAIVKHQSSKNANYGGVLDYYTLKHEEVQSKNGTRHKLILDEFGFAQPRENCAVCYISANGEEREPELWQSACMQTNMLFGKNQEPDDRKNHEYIISHPEEDREKMTMEDLLNEGKEFAQRYFKGYDVLISPHRDTDNDHVHITINSIRALDLEREEPWMMKGKTGKVLDCEMKAGGKHQQSPALLRDMNEWLVAYTQEHGYVIEDNNAKADEKKRARYGSKNGQMRAALLEAAARSQDMKDLRRIMKEDYNIKLTVSSTGKTISVLHPDNDKAVRLRSLELEPADLTRLMKGPGYTYNNETEAQQVQKELEAEEQKKYIEWIKERRQRNNERAEDMISKAEDMVAEKIRAKGERYNKNEFQDLWYLIKQTTYVEANLQTEKEKLDRLLERWDKYNDPQTPETERQKHAGYIRWCGCDPTSSLELEDLKAEREIIEAQQQNTIALRNVLGETSEQWKGHNEINRAENDLLWAKNRKHQLKAQLRNVRASRKKLWEIHCNCRDAAARRIIGTELWKKADHYKDLWSEKVQKEMEIQKKLRDIKKQQKEAKERLREIKKRPKGAYIK